MITILVRTDTDKAYYESVQELMCVNTSRKKISSAVFRVYIYLDSAPEGLYISTKFLVKKLHISKKSVLKYMKELRELDLVYTAKIEQGVSFMFLGSMENTASELYEIWKKEDDKMQGEISE